MYDFRMGRRDRKGLKFGTNEESASLLTGEGALEFLISEVGWVVARQFIAIHEGLLSGRSDGSGLESRVNQATGMPEYRREDLSGWGKRMQRS